MVTFWDFILITWALGSIVSILAIIEAAKDRKLTLSELAAVFYNAFVAVFALTLVVASFSYPIARVLQSPLSTLLLQNVGITAGLSQRDLISLTLMTLVIALTFTTLMARGLRVATAVLTVFMAAMILITLYTLPPMTLLNLLAISAIATFVGSLVGYVAYVLFIEEF